MLAPRQKIQRSSSAPTSRLPRELNGAADAPAVIAIPCSLPSLRQRALSKRRAMLVGIEVGSPLLNNRRFLSHAEVVGYRLEHRCRIRGVRAWLVRCSTQGVNCEVLQPVGLLSVAGKMGEMLL